MICSKYISDIHSSHYKESIRRLREELSNYTKYCKAFPLDKRGIRFHKRRCKHIAMVLIDIHADHSCSPPTMKDIYCI